MGQNCHRGGLLLLRPALCLSLPRAPSQTGPKIAPERKA